MVFIFTVISVSLDAYFAGLAFNVFKNMSVLQSIYAGSFTFIACMLTMSFARAFGEYTDAIEIVGGIILVYFGIKYLFANKQPDIFVQNKTSDVTLLGISVSTDAACVSATITGVSVLACSAAMFICHTLFLCLSTATARFTGFLDRMSLLSGIFLILLGINKIL